MAEVSGKKPAKTFLEVARVALASGVDSEDAETREKFTALAYFMAPIFEAVEERNIERLALVEVAIGGALGFLLCGITKERTLERLGFVQAQAMAWQTLFMKLAQDVTKAGGANVH